MTRKKSVELAHHVYVSNRYWASLCGISSSKGNIEDAEYMTCLECEALSDGYSAWREGDDGWRVARRIK